MPELVAEKKKRGSGRIEYLASKKEIQLLLNQGYTAKGVFEKLHSEKKLLNLSYQMLLYYLKGGVSRRKRQVPAGTGVGTGTEKPIPEPIPAPVPAASTPKIATPNKQKQFNHDPLTKGRK